MSGDDMVLSRVDEDIGVVTMNRPQVRNALNPQVERLLEEAVRELAARPEVKALVLTGAGSTFCAGADFSMLGSGDRKEDYNPASHLRFVYLTQLGKPVCAAIQGACLGSGLALALHCDLRFTTASSRFRAPFADLGLVGEMGIPWLLTRLCGMGRAMEWLLSRRTIEATEALQSGLVNRILDDEDHASQAIAQLRQWIDGTSSHSLAVMKRQVWQAYGMSLAEAEYHSGAETRLAIARPEYRERVARIRQKASRA